MTANDPQRFIVRLEVYAAASHMDLDVQEASGDPDEIKKIVDSLAKADPSDIEDRTYRLLSFDVCDDCRKELLRNPLG